MLAFAGGVAFAVSHEPQFSITITSGTLNIEMVDSGGTAVTSPVITMQQKSFSFSNQTSTGTFGAASQKIRVSNPTGTATWTASIAAKDGNTSTWSGSSYTMDFNDSSGAQLTINPSGGTITAGGGVITGVSAGSSSAFDQGTTDSITLYSADGVAATYDYFDLTGVSVSQNVPGGQEADTYTIYMTLTVS